MTRLEILSTFSRDVNRRFKYSHNRSVNTFVLLCLVVDRKPFFCCVSLLSQYFFLFSNTTTAPDGLNVCFIDFNLFR